MYKGQITLFFLIVMSISSFAQRGELLARAKAAYLNQQYFDAVFYYEQASLDGDLDIKSQYELGISQYRTNLYIPAERTLNKLQQIDTTRKFPDAFYYLGQVNKNLTNYGEAIEHFLSAAEIIVDSNPSLAEKSLEQVAFCEWAMGAIKSPEAGVDIQHLEENLSSEFALFSPRIIKDSFYFTSFETPEIDQKENKRRNLMKIERGTPDNANIVASLDLENLHLGHLAINTNQDKLYFSVCTYTEEDDIHCKIFTRTISEANELGELVELPASINLANSSNSQPFIAKDPETEKDVLYFVSDRVGGKGLRDIWMSVIETDSTFGEPINLESINTDEDEVSPFYDVISERLFFSSKGHKTLGGFDILFSTKSDSIWSTPVNPGLPLNSSVDDLSYYFDPETNQIFFASNREKATPFPGEEGLCCSDLFEVDQLPQPLEIDIYVCGEKSQEVIDFTLHYRNNYNRGEVVMTRTNDSLGILNYPGILPGDYYVSYTYEGNVDTLNIDHRYGKEKDWRINISKRLFEVDYQYVSFTNNKSTGRERLVKEGMVNFYQDQNLVLSHDLGSNNQFTIQLEPGEYEYFTSFPESSLYIGQKDQLLITGNERGCRLNRQVEVAYLPNFFPVELFFDNNKPAYPVGDPTKSIESYVVSYFNYLDEIPNILSVINNAEADNLTIRRESKRMEFFFDKTVTPNYESLNIFLSNLIIFFQEQTTQDYTLTLQISGYTSSRAADDYNKKLSARRNDAVIQYLSGYKDENGSLQPYIQTGQLKFEILNLGEEKNILENTFGEDSIFSKYGHKASKERKVTIEQLKIEKLNSDDQ